MEAMSSPASRPVPPAAASQLNLRGAVDLSVLKQRQAPPAAPAAGPAAGAGPASTSRPRPGTAGAEAPALRVEVTEANFQDLVELSRRCPVVFALWAAYSPESAGVLDALERIVQELCRPAGAGRRGHRGLPPAGPGLPGAGRAHGGGRAQGPARSAVPGRGRRTADPRTARRTAQGCRSQRRVRQRRRRRPPAEPAPAPLPPLHQEAFDAIEAGDYAAAAAAYRQALDRDAGRRRGQGRPGPGGTHGPAAEALRTGGRRAPPARGGRTGQPRLPSSESPTSTSPGATWRMP